MVHAWDGVTCVSATARIKYFSPMQGDPDYPRLLEPEDVERPVHRVAAWWHGPDRWRYDVDGWEGTHLSYVGIGDRWWLWQAGALLRSRTTEDARQQHLTDANNLLYGRPYLSPEENAHLWLWLNPAIWVASYSLALNNWCAPLPDDIYHQDQVVHVLAGAGLERNPPTEDDRELRQRWLMWDWDRDEELGDYVNFFQLWVDMRTGFCRRMAAEGANGRQWDILVDSLILNDESQVPDAMFAGPAATP